MSLRRILSLFLFLYFQLFSSIVTAQFVLNSGDAPFNVNAGIVVEHDTAISVDTSGGGNPIHLNIAPQGSITQNTTQLLALQNNDPQTPPPFNSAILVTNIGQAPFILTTAGPIFAASSFNEQGHLSHINAPYYSPAIGLGGNSTWHHNANVVRGDVVIYYNHAMGGPNNSIINLNGGRISGNLYTKDSMLNEQRFFGVVNVNQGFTTEGNIEGFSAVNVVTPHPVNITHRIFAEHINLQPGSNLNLHAGGTLQAVQAINLLGQSNLRIHGGNIIGNIVDDGNATVDVEAPFTVNPGNSIRATHIRVNAHGGGLGALTTEANSPLLGFNDFTVFQGGHAHLRGGATSAPLGSMINHGTLLIDSGQVTVNSLRNTNTGNLELQHNPTITVPQGFVNEGTIVLQDTTTIVGNYTQNAGSTLTSVVIDPQHFGRLQVTGAANILPGSTIQLQLPQNHQLHDGDVFDVVTAANGQVHQVNVQAPHNAPFIFAQIPHNNVVRLTAQRSLYLVKMAETPHAAMVARALEDQRFVNVDPKFTSFITALDNAPKPDINQAMQALVPNHTRGMFYSGLAPMRMAMHRAEQRLGLGRRGVNLVDAGYSSGDLFHEKGSYGPIVFANGMSQKRNHGFGGFKATTQGFGLLGDVAVCDCLQVGAGVIYAGSTVRTEEDCGKNAINSLEGIMYGGVNRGRLFLDGSLVLAQNWYRLRRDIIRRTFTALSKHHGFQYAGKLRAGYDIPFCGFAITPVATLQYTALYQTRFKEHCVVTRVTNAEHTHLGQAGLGARLSFLLECQRFVPELHAMVLRDLNNPKMQVTSQFTGGGAAFTLAGPTRFAKTSVNVGAGITAFIADNTLLTAIYDFEGKKRYRSNSGSVKIRWLF